MEKVKETIHKVTHPSEHKATDTTGTHTTGTHTTGTHTGTGHHTSGATGTSGTAGPHSSNLANKADPRVDSDLDGSRNMGAASYGTGANQNYGNTGTGLTGSHNTAGPHSADLANKADPRVDSDLDGSRNMGAASYGTGANQNYGNSGTGLTGSHNTGSTNTGPHSSNLANKADPRVDSDLDGSRNAGAASYGTGAGNNYDSTGTGYNAGSTNAGPHSSNLANKIDPRVDSDLDGSRNAGAASYGTGATQNYGSGGMTSGSTGYNSGSTNTGPHSSNLANKADPRIDSDNDGSRNAGAASYGAGAHNTQDSYGTQGVHSTHGAGLTGSGGIGSGPAPNTAGPHKSDMLNKVDPRVDSDRDGSRTVGSAPNTGSTY